jgi:hypothetical protein
MKKINNQSMFHTGICEDAISKRTVISAISGIKKLLNEPIYTVSNRGVIKSSFSEVSNLQGCVVISGFSVSGITLLDMYKKYESSDSLSENTRYFLTILSDIIDASETLQRNTGFYPKIVLNGIYIDKDKDQFIFLPSVLVELLNKYIGVDEKQIINYLFDKKSEQINEDEFIFVKSLGKLVYLFFSKDIKSKTDNIFDIGNIVNDIPRIFADTIWNLLQGKQVELREFKDAVIGALNSHDSTIEKIPFGRRKSVLTLKYSLGGFFQNRKRLIVAIIVLAGIFSYLLYDSFSNRNRIDHTAGLNAEQIVELYLYGIDTLELDIVDSVFYKRAGKEIKNELSTLYVMLKFELAFGNVLIGPEEIDEGDLSGTTDKALQGKKVYGLEDIEIQKIVNGDEPTFSATYKRILSAGDEINVYSIVETLKLKQFKDRWYIIRSDRKIINTSN